MEEKNVNSANNENDLFGFAAFDKYESEHIAAPQYSYWKSVWRTFIKNKFTVCVAIVMLILVGFSLIQPSISGYDPLIAPNVTDESMRFQQPSREHIFGTDNVGNEVFDVVWAGARNSIIISFVCTFINMVIGITVGAVWGFSKKMDKWMIEVYNVVSNVPFLLLAMILSYVMGAGMGTLIFVMCVTDWIFVAFFIRTQTMIIRDREYNLASKCLGTSTWTMIKNNILPYLISVIMTYIARMIPSLISYEVFLSYMGLGLGVTKASLGRMISIYTSYMNGYPHLFWIPVTVLAMLSISLYIVGQRLADAADPRTHM
ncbi:MAG: ABC transporter permease [Lachnospiraceae bacterium]|nr:ABC transporter permease [Lachnospiraceae bacterium]